MLTLTFAISKGGVGKSLLTANVGVALAKKGYKVILVEGDPNRPLQAILGAEVKSEATKLDDVIKRNMDIEEATYETSHQNLFLIPSGISLESYFEIDPILFARKLLTVVADFMLIDVPFPLGKAAFLSLGVCQYFLMILTEDEFNLCVESAIDTNRLGRYFLDCVPIGFVLNRIKTPGKFTPELVGDLESILHCPCIARIAEDQHVSRSYGGVETHKAFLAYDEIQENGFKKGIDDIVARIIGGLPKSRKNVLELLENVAGPLRS